MLDFYFEVDNLWFHLNNGDALELINFLDGYKIFIKDSIVLDFMDSLGIGTVGAGMKYSTLDDVLMCEGKVFRCKYEFPLRGNVISCFVLSTVALLDLSGFIFCGVMDISGVVNRCIVPVEMALYFGQNWRSFAVYENGFKSVSDNKGVIFDLTSLDAHPDLNLTSFMRYVIRKAYLNCYGRLYLSNFLNDYIYSHWVADRVDTELSLLLRVLLLNKDFVGGVLEDFRRGIFGGGSTKMEFVEWLSSICEGIL